jgi:hypothetical protein
MPLSDRRLKRWYREFNRQYFDGQLPDNTEVWWEHVDGAIACVDYDGCGVTFDESTDTFLIRINPAVAWSTRQARFALLHECAHIKVGIKFGHRAKFQLEMLRLAHCGALKALW